MTLFDYDSTVQVVSYADDSLHPGEIASVIGVFSKRPKGQHFDQFPDGVIYTIEFENGDAIDIHESYLKPKTE